MEPISRTRYIFGKKLSVKTKEGEEGDHKESASHMGETTELQFIYLDSDLCITMIDDESGVLNVLTKNEEWRESRKNKVCFWILLLLSL